MRPLFAAVLLGSLFAAGCVTAPTIWPDDKPAPPTKAARPPAPKPSAVKPDHVKPDTAYKAVEALQAELEADAQPPEPPPVTPAGKGK